MPALSPAKISKKHIASIPEVVFDAINELLTKGAGGSVSINQNELLELLAKKAPEISRETYFDNGWLDFEAKYRAQGWKVEYDKPAYYETYEAHWVFTPWAPLIPIVQISVASASIYGGFVEAVQATCDDAKGRPCTKSVLDAVEARLNSVACDAIRCGELLNKTAPRATVNAYPNGRGSGMALEILWSERPVINAESGHRRRNPALTEEPEDGP